MEFMYTLILELSLFKFLFRRLVQNSEFEKAKLFFNGDIVQLISLGNKHCLE